MDKQQNFVGEIQNKDGGYGREKPYLSWETAHWSLNGELRDCIVLKPQQKTVVGIRNTAKVIGARARSNGVFFYSIQWWSRRGTHKVAGNPMRPVFRNPFGLPPLRFETHAVATSTHRKMPA